MRRKITTMLLLVMTGAMPALAQSGDDFVIREKANIVTLGPRVGATFTTMGQPNECNLYDGAGIGVTLGAALRTRLGRATRDTQEGGTGFLGFGLDLLYKQNNVKTIGSDNLNLGYFELPVSVQVFPMARSRYMNKFYVEAGPSFAILASKSPSVIDVDQANVSYRIGDLSGGDVRFLIGLGYTFPKTSLNLDVRYYIGTGKLANNFPCKQNSLEIAVSWQFKIAKY